MCGIVGALALNEKGKAELYKISAAVYALQKRGPDDEGIYFHNNLVLAHRRLSIIDTSKGGAQPMTDESGRFTIIFNGEFFNFKEHRSYLQSKGISLRSESDTEVLLNLFILEKEKCLERINGFFALAIYDNQEEELFMARDRFGVKPLLIYEDESNVFFASEMKGLVSLGIKKELDHASLLAYFQLNYIPAPWSIYRHVRKMVPGTFLKYSLKRKVIVEENNFYEIPYRENLAPVSYEAAKKQMRHLVESAVQKRLISDVPLGSFLSGGVDSSIVSAIAAKHTNHLKTFSIGFKDEPMFDETHYATLIAKKYKTVHTVFSLSNDDLFGVLHDVLKYIDEPFADSSALNVYLLSQCTRKHVTVALSGDGADELFGGYNKHRAEWLIRNDKLFTMAVKLGAPFLKSFPGSRNSAFGNKLRQLQRFSEGLGLTAAERYWRWCGYADEREVIRMLSHIDHHATDEYDRRKKTLTKQIKGTKELNDVFLTDVNLVLQSDMLVKVDLMSMANSLEIRTPFLDYEVVNWAFNLPSSYKIDRVMQKKILKDTFSDLLPAEILQRNKQGFEVPLLKWFRTDLKSIIMDDLLNESFIIEQGLFAPEEIRKLKNHLFSSNPGEATARIWGLIVFQYWWKKNF